MAMTEKQGGSDLRQTQTRAEPNGDGTWSLVGHKWFFSVPHSDVFLTLARTEEGVSCFAVAGWLPDGSRNRIQIQRLKDKCGNRSNASSEVEFRGAVAHLIGEPGRGIRTGLSMNHYTRLDFAVGSAGLMRQAVAQAAHHVAHRRAFQRSLIDQPIMANVVADLALEAEAAAWLSFRFVAALDREADERGRAPARADRRADREVLGVQARARRRRRGPRMPRRQRLHRRPPHGAAVPGGAAQRHLGGHGQRHLPRRAALDRPRAATACRRSWTSSGRRAAPTGATTPSSTRSNPSSSICPGTRARPAGWWSGMALAMSAGLLIRHAPAVVADAFVATRLAGGWAGHFGDLPLGLDAGAIARRAVPAAA